MLFSRPTGTGIDAAPAATDTAERFANKNGTGGQSIGGGKTINAGRRTGIGPMVTNTANEESQSCDSSFSR